MTDNRIRGLWWVEETDDVWKLYYAGTDDPDANQHGYQIIKAPKRGTKYKEYWPDELDTDFILTALNGLKRARALDVVAWAAKRALKGLQVDTPETMDLRKALSRLEGL